MTNRTTSPIDDGKMVKVGTNCEMVKVGTKTPEPTPLTQPTEFSEQNGKAHILDDPDPDPSLSDSSLKKKKRDKKKSVGNIGKMTRQTHH